MVIEVDFDNDDISDDEDVPDNFFLGNNWYLKETVNFKYYSPFCSSKRIMRYVEGGEKEILEFISKNPGWNSYGQYNNIFQRQNEKETSDESIPLPGGSYMYKAGDYTTPERLIPITPRTDSYLPGSCKTEPLVRDDLTCFMGAEKQYQDLNVMYKMGILMYGTQGTGKTSLIRYVLNQILDKDAIVIFMEGSSFFSTDFVKKIQKTLKDRFKVFIFEELTGQTAYTDRLERLLTFLDGELSVDKSISFATTNYPENLPRNVADRPSRFDKLYEVKPPAEAERKKLLEFFLKKEPTKEELEASKDFSPAHIKEIALMHLIQKQGIMEAINKLKLRTRLVDKAFAEAKNGGGFGFN